MLTDHLMISKSHKENLITASEGGGHSQPEMNCDLLMLTARNKQLLERRLTVI
jgi:hypothetical protein